MRAKAQKATTKEDESKGSEDNGGQAAGESSEQPEKKIKFRNYHPYDNSLKAAVKENIPATEQSAPVVKEQQPTPPSTEDVIKKELSQFQDNELNLMPKKPNWDLKVQVEGKLQKLKNRTQKAIVEILREKLATEQEDE